MGESMTSVEELKRLKIEYPAEEEITGCKGFYNKAARNSNIEGLRIIAMFCIVLSHYSAFSKVNPDALSFGFSKILLDSVAIGKLGVAVFVMITGYFMVNLKFNINRVVNIVLQTLFYTVGIYAIFLITGGAFSFKGVIESLFPIITCQYWFVSAYVILSLLTPFINKVLNGITKKQFIALLGVLIFYNSVAPTFLHFNAFTYGGHLCYMVMFYCVGAFIRKYPPKKPSKTLEILLVGISAGLLVLSVVAIDFLAERFTFLAGKSGKFYTVSSVLILTLAIGLLLLFTQMKPRTNKVINVLGSCTFGVYLIHANNYMNEWIWGGFCNNSSYAAPLRLVMHMCICVVCVFVICTFIEFIRQYGLEKKLFKKFYEFVYKTVNAMLEKLKSGINKILVK